uniref:Aspartate aminotransferase n=1 Tax=Dicyema japonicum TaxID=399803 RepID=B9ZYV4_DICJA|nr:aspartate aminotransferase [Dicyema japonicum]BAJ09730.1 aspartate aminotransferase [Dicyema japonicum]
MSFLSTKLKLLPPDPIFKANEEFQASTNSQKLNLSIGAYTDEDGTVYVLNTVKEAKAMILQDSKDTHQYLPITGYPQLNDICGKLIFGDDNSFKNKFVAFQVLGGTGGFFVGAELLNKYCNLGNVVIPSKTWGSHNSIFGNMNFVITNYKIEANSDGSLAIDQIVEDLKKCPEKSVVILQACCHNPCGLDPEQEGWKRIANVIMERNLVPFLDLAYMGFGSLNMADDAWAVRYFASLGIDFLVSVSFSKNFGLYGERIGCLMVFAKDTECLEALASNVKAIIRCAYSTPPSFGAKIVMKIFSDDILYRKWQEELKTLTKRVIKVRGMLYENLKSKGIDWPQITKARGFFFQSPLSEEQVNRLKADWDLFILPNGRINMAGLLADRVDDLAAAIKDVST